MFMGGRLSPFPLEKMKKSNRLLLSSFNCTWQFLTASLKQKKLIDMEDHPDEESFEVQEIRSPVKELEYLHRDETGDFGSRSPSLDEEEILLLPMEGKVSEIPTADYPPVSAVSFFRKIYSDVFQAGGYKW